MADSLTFALPLEDKQSWSKLLAAIPRDFREANGNLQAPKKWQQEPETSPTCLHIGNQPLDCGIRLIPEHDPSLNTERLVFLNDRGTKRPRAVRIDYDQLGINSAWPQAIDYIASIIWQYSNLEYTGQIAFLTKIFSSGSSRCLLILEDNWGAIDGSPGYPPILRIDTPDGDDTDKTLLAACKDLGLAKLEIPETVQGLAGR